jgi:ABC-type transport system involved in multi-copper enzyme maturation permease subunit
VLIVGIGVFDRDLSPKLHTFWRSRPINPDLWYWTKYLTGITVIAVVLLIPAGIAGYLSSSGLSNPPGQPTPFAVLMMVVSVFAAVYALSVATICLIRMTIYAAILSAGMLAVGTGVLWFFMDIMDMELSELLVTAIVMALTVAVLAALVGWWAVRRDVGWRK